MISTWTRGSPTGPRLLPDLTALQCSAGCQPPRTMCGREWEWWQNFAWVGPTQPRLPSDSKSCPLVKRGEWELLDLLLLTQQTAEHGAVEPKRNELPSFHDRHCSLCIIPIKSPTGPQLLLDLTALHCSAVCQPPPTTRSIQGVGESECGFKTLPGLVLCDPGSPLTWKLKSHPTHYHMTSHRGGCLRHPTTGSGAGSLGHHRDARHPNTLTSPCTMGPPLITIT